MEFLKKIFDEQLVAEIADNGVVIIESSALTPSTILKEFNIDGYNFAFTTWAKNRKDGLLRKADEILALHDNQGRFRNLRVAYRNGAIIPFVGAGMSMSSGYPGWTNFLWQLRKETRVTEEQLARLLDNGQYEQAAQVLADDMPTGSFDEALENIFGHAEEELAGPIQLLPHVFDTAAITTNFDDVLKRCYDQAEKPFSETLLGINARELPRRLGVNSKILIKLHGKATSGQERILTFSEYQFHYGAERSLLSAIEAIFSKTLLFMGCSLGTDRTILAMKEYVASKGHDAITRHYAFVALKEDEDRLARRDALAAANIFPIWYSDDDDHDECIEALLHKLAES